MVSLYFNKNYSSRHPIHDTDYPDLLEDNLKMIALRRTGGRGHHGLEYQQQSPLESEPHRGLNAVFAGGGQSDMESNDDNTLAMFPEIGSNMMNKLVDSKTPSKSTSHKNDDHVRCKNSVQGKLLISDDKGFVCHRKDMNQLGCCSLNEADLSLKKHQRYSCETCNMETGCCAIFEYCVSCCLDPDKKALLSKVMENVSSSPDSLVLSSLSDGFDFCLAKCRTSSLSVQHENSYRDPKTKHCFATESVIKTMNNKIGQHPTSTATAVVASPTQDVIPSHASPSTSSSPLPSSSPSSLSSHEVDIRKESQVEIPHKS